ncbi:MAG: MarR family winged helix-turn-helix transcriptional regulator [Burkholderiaceae bacterium]
MEQESLDRNFGLILHDVARLLRTNFDRRVRDLGLTRSQWWVLTHLYREDGLTQTELADLMEIEKPSLGRLLDRLEAKNWIKRSNDPHDRRANRVYLTVDVKPMVREMRQHASAVRQQALAGLGENQREQFIDTLLQIKENLIESDASPTSGHAAASSRVRR